MPLVHGSELTALIRRWRGSPEQLPNSWSRHRRCLSACPPFGLDDEELCRVRSRTSFSSLVVGRADYTDESPLSTATLAVDPIFAALGEVVRTSNRNSSHIRRIVMLDSLCRVSPVHVPDFSRSPPCRLIDGILRHLRGEFYSTSWLYVHSTVLSCSLVFIPQPECDIGRPNARTRKSEIMRVSLFIWSPFQRFL